MEFDLTQALIRSGAARGRVCFRLRNWRRSIGVSYEYLCVKERQDCQESSAVEDLDGFTSAGLSWQQPSVAQWKGKGAEGDFYDSTYKRVLVM